MALSSADFNLTFDYSSSPKVFILQDTSDYAGASVSTTVATGCITNITAPDGTTIYANSDHTEPDIDADVSLINNSISLPLMGDGSVQQGAYSVTYQVRISGASIDVAYDVTKTKTYTLNYSPVSLSIGGTVDCNIPRITGTDNTSYTTGGVAPTVLRDFRIVYPAVANTSDVTGTTSTISTTSVYVVKNSILVYNLTLSSTLTYSMGSGIYIKDLLTCTHKLDVQCDPNLCDVYCGLWKLWNTWTNAKGTTYGNDALTKLQKAISIMSLAKQAIECGKQTHVSAYLADIRALGDFNDDCGCSEGTPVLLTGLAGIVANIIVEAGNGVTVTEVESGGQTTYTVSLQTALYNKLNNMSVLDFAAGTGITISSSTAADGTVTYTITNSATTDNPDSFFYELQIVSNKTAGLVPTLTAVKSKKYGSVFTTSGVSIVNNNASTYTIWETSPNSFTLSSFKATSGDTTPIYPYVQVVSGIEFDVTITSYGTDSVTFSLIERANPGWATYGKAVFLDDNITSHTIIIKLDA
jgi:hypothetical protein